MRHGVSEGVICPGGTTFLQFVADSTDHDMAALDGVGTHRGSGSVAIAGGGHAGAACPVHGVPAGAVLRSVTQVGGFCSVWGMLVHSVSVLAFTGGVGA